MIDPRRKTHVRGLRTLGNDCLTVDYGDERKSAVDWIPILTTGIVRESQKQIIVNSAGALYTESEFYDFLETQDYEELT